MRVDLVAQRADLRLLRLHRQLGGMPLLLLDRDAVGQREIGRGPGEIEPEPVHERVEEIGHEALCRRVEHNGIADRLDAGGGEGERRADRRLPRELAQPERPQAAVEHVAEERAEQRESEATHDACRASPVRPRCVVELGAHQHDDEVDRPEDDDQHARAPLSGGRRRRISV